jgi:SAM-dependent methyltransferase
MEVFIPKKNLLKRTDKEIAFIDSTFLKDIKKNAKILDLGIGPLARFSIFFSKKGYNVTGIDISPTTLDYARKNAERVKTKIKLIQDDLITLSNVKGKFDLIFCWGTFGHIPAYLTLEALSSFNKKLKKKGYCLIDFWVEEEIDFKKVIIYFLYSLGHLIKRIFKKTFPVNCSKYSLEEIEDMANRTGFKIIKKIKGRYLFQKIK